MPSVLVRRGRRDSLSRLGFLLVVLASLISSFGAAALLGSCSDRDKPSVAMRREQLFSLSYGPGEDQLDLFQIDKASSTEKTRITMSEGIFYIANGAGMKVVRYSSFGDPLSMIYNADRNSEPLLLKPLQAKPTKGAEALGTAEGDGLGRTASAYPFRSVGEIAVDSKQRVYVEDRLPPERRVRDAGSEALLDHVVLRFGKDGRLIDYLGQEGIGGTPFPFLLGLYVLASNDCVVVSMTQAGWMVHWFDENGVLQSSLKLRRDDLPVLDKGKSYIASLDKILPDLSGNAILMKVDYYRGTLDPATKESAGVEFAESWTYRMDLRDGKYVDRWKIPAIERTVKDDAGHYIKSFRVPEFLGVAGRDFFFIYAEDDGRTYVSTYDRSSKAVSRYSIDIAADELFFNSYFLSDDGVLCALLGTKYEARVVWWRFDKFIGTNAGIAK
jgi:hypothetical protein